MHKSIESKKYAAEKEYLTEQEKRLAKEIEESPLGDGNKMDLILVWRKLKPATELDLVLKAWRPGEERPKLTTQEEKGLVEKLESKITALGLRFVSDEKEYQDAKIIRTKDGEKIERWGRESKTFYIAPTKEIAQKLAGVWKKESGHDKSTELGHLFGFPESAIKAYKEVEKRGYEEENLLIGVGKQELPKEIREQEFMAFA